MKQVRRKFHQRGMSTALSLVFLAGFVVLGGMALSMSMQADKMGERKLEKNQANQLAETAIMELYDTIRSEMKASGSYPTDISNRTLRTADNITLGTYSARVASAVVSQEDIGGSDDPKRVTTYVFTLEGTGTARYNIRSQMKAKFTGSIIHNLSRRETVVNTGPDVDMMSFPTGAIVSNTQVNIVSNGGLRTYSPDGNSGHIIANQGISWSPASGNKNANFNNNVLDIQGQYIVHQSSGNFTRSVNGLGNSNGATNYRSPNPGSGWPVNGANQIVETQNPIQFANGGAVNQWVRDWRDIVGGNNANRFVSAVTTPNDIPTDPNLGQKFIRTPAYIDGDLEIPSGQSLRFLPTSSNPRNNVVYVRGNIRNAGLLMNLGVKVVFEGSYSDTSSAEYRLDTQNSPFPTMGRVLQNSALIGVGIDRNAIRISTNSSATTGLIYAARGGIRVNSSNAEFRGMLLSGGEGSHGGIDVQPGGGNSFVVHYTPEAAIPADYDITWSRQINVDFVPGGVSQEFNPTRLRDWAVLR